MPTTTTITTAIGATDTIINNGGGALNDTNTVAQLAAAAAGLGTLATPGGAYAAITTGMAALDTGIQVINADINAGASKSDIAADSLTILGDVALIVGAYATNIPGAKPIATVAEVVGNGAALSGVGIKNWDAVVANTPIAINELVTEVNEEAQSAKTALITNLNGVSNTIANAWSSTEAALSNVFNAISTSMNDISNTNFMLDAGSTSSSVSSAETSLVSLFNAIGGSAQNVTDTVTNNSFVISNNNISNINGSASFGTNGGSTSLTTTGNSLNQTETDSIGSGSISDAIQNYNSSGAVQFSQTTTTNTSGQVSASISGTGDVTALNNAAITVASDTGNLNGSNEIAYVNGANETVNSTGSGNTVAIATGLTVTINGSNLNIDAAAGDVITLNGTAGTNHISGSGAYSLIVNGVNKGNGNNYGTYGFAGDASVVTAALDPNNNAIVQNDLADGNLAGAAAAQASLQQLQDVISTGSTASVLEGAKWNGNVITWSAEGNLAAYQGDVQAAFNAWGAATGLTFEEVSNPSQADINLEFSDLNTPASGIVGYTNYTASNGQMGNATVQIEDPNQDALIDGTTYSGTSATLQQTLEHEIGHALGFADNNNPNSIMDYYLSSRNQTLSSNDVVAAQSLYGTSPASASTETSYLQLIQAMASFGTDTGAATSPANIPEPYMLTGTIIANPMQPQH